MSNQSLTIVPCDDIALSLKQQLSLKPGPASYKISISCTQRVPSSTVMSVLGRKEQSYQKLEKCDEVTAKLVESDYGQEDFESQIEMQFWKL